jgi:hypothetical protein
MDKRSHHDKLGQAIVYLVGKLKMLNKDQNLAIKFSHTQYKTEYALKSDATNCVSFIKTVPADIKHFVSNRVYRENQQ